ncbi:MAG: ribonuclease D [Lentilitoribacter sp.]
MMTNIRLHKGDMSAQAAARYKGDIAIDTETLGLIPRRDRLCVVQLSSGDGTADVIQIAKGQKQAPNLVALLEDQSKTKLFHYGRFDVAVLYYTFGVTCSPIFCTKIASKLTRTYTDRHGLKDVCRELLSVELSKHQQSSDWAAEKLTDAQLAYAASDVLHLHALRDKMTVNLEREGRLNEAEACFEFLPTRAKLDLMGWEDSDIFAHS